MKPYVIYPNIVGELAQNKQTGESCYKILDWDGDDLIKIDDYLVSEMLAEKLINPIYTGFSLQPAKTLNATKYVAPKWMRLEIVQTGANPDIAIDHERRLVVSENIYTLLLGFNLRNARIIDLKYAPTLAKRDAEILMDIKLVREQAKARSIKK